MTPRKGKKLDERRLNRTIKQIRAIMSIKNNTIPAARGIATKLSKYGTEMLCRILR